MAALPEHFVRAISDGAAAAPDKVLRAAAAGRRHRAGLAAPCVGARQRRTPILRGELAGAGRYSGCERATRHFSCCGACSVVEPIEGHSTLCARSPMLGLLQSHTPCGNSCCTCCSCAALSAGV